MAGPSEQAKRRKVDRKMLLQPGRVRRPADRAPAHSC